MKLRTTIAALMAGSCAFASGAHGALQAGGDRSHSAARYGLELDGVFCGFVQSVEGGHATADVVTEKIGGDHLQKKHLANVRYEPIAVSTGTGMCSSMYDWIKDSLSPTGAKKRKNGAVLHMDFDGNVVAQTTFANALVTELGMPACDGASKDAAKMTIKFQPEYTRRVVGGGKAKPGIKEGNRKMWVPANFRLTFEGKDEAATNETLKRVNKIEAITIKQTTVNRSVGDARDYQKEPASVEYPNLVITFPESHSDALYRWHEDFVIKGNNGQDKEKTATLTYLTPDLKQALFTLTFRGLGIFKLSPDKVESGSEQVRRVKAELYSEQIDFTASQ